MSPLILDPFAAKVHWSGEGAVAERAWPELTRSFVGRIAHEVRSRNAIIGHIKGIARFEEHVLRVNCVSAALPVDVEGDFPPNTPGMVLDLVVLAYGLVWDDARSAVEIAIEQTGPIYNCCGRLQVFHQNSSHPHEHK